MQNKIAGMERSEEKSDKIGEQKVEMETWAAIIIAALQAAIITSLPLPLPLPPFWAADPKGTMSYRTEG